MSAHTPQAFSIARCTDSEDPGIAPGGYSIHYTNTNSDPYPGANPG